MIIGIFSCKIRKKPTTFHFLGAFCSVVVQNVFEDIFCCCVECVLDKRQGVDVGHIQVSQVVLKPLQSRKALPEIWKRQSHQLIFGVHNHMVVLAREEGSLDFKIVKYDTYINM